MRTPRSERLPAEEVLFDNGLIQRRSPQRRTIIGCLACKWSNAQLEGQDPEAYAQEIVGCTGVKSGVAQPLLRHLEAIGVVSSEFENEDPRELGRPRRRLYTPVDTEIGQQFEAALEIPEHCPTTESSE